MTVFHIATVADWAARSRDSYVPAGYEAEGFVHCSAADQVPGTANRLFAGRHDLILLAIDEGALASPLVWEDSHGSGTEFPHVYGPIDLAAVAQVLAFAPGPDGRFDRWRPAQPPD
ncbi:MAG: DUF952 domain-containing protein [Acidimicrobiia bacterium]